MLRGGGRTAGRRGRERFDGGAAVGRDSTNLVKKPATIDQYLAGLSEDKRAALEKLRRTIRAAAPEAEECISYGVPSMRLGGRFLVGFGAGVAHCAFYPGGTALAPYKAELARYETSKGTIRFQPSRGLPVALVRKLVRSRVRALSAPRGRKK
jgi:uncharacterized protein YdhG (YjbR/CyaY superfamily)